MDWNGFFALCAVIGPILFFIGIANSLDNLTKK